jgi:hypothetical protein
MVASPAIFLFIPIVVAFLAFCLSSGIFLVVRAVKTKLYHMIYLSVFFLLTFSYYILVFFSYIETAILWWPRICIYQVALVTNLMFIQKAFYSGRRSPFKFIFVLMLVLIVLNVTTAIIRDLFDGGFLDEVIGRVVLTTGGSTELAVVTLWQSHVSFKAYNKYKDGVLEPHVKMRYLLFGLAGMVLFMFAIIDVPATIIAMVAIFDYYIIEVVSLLLILIYTTINFLTWVMPGWFKRFLNRHYKTPGPEAPLSEDEIMKYLEDANK